MLTLLCSLLSRLNDLEHFFFGNTPHFWQWYREFGRLLIPLVLDYTKISEWTLCRTIGDKEFDILALLKAFALVGFDLSRRYCGRGVLEGSLGAEDLTFRSSCALICFFICIFS